VYRQSNIAPLCEACFMYVIKARCPGFIEGIDRSILLTKLLHLQVGSCKDLQDGEFVCSAPPICANRPFLTVGGETCASVSSIPDRDCM